MAETPPVPPKPKGLAGALKKVPTPVWLGLGGASLGLGYAFLRDRNAPATDAVVTGDEAAALGDVPVDSLSYQPSPIGGVSNVPLGGTDAAETVGAVGQTALETSLSTLNSIVTALLTREYGPNYQQPMQPSGSAPPRPGPIPQSQPPPPAKPKAPSKPKRKAPAGYEKGDTIHTKKGPKRFPGAVGHKSIFRDNKKGVEGFHVAYGNGVLQRWHYDFKGKGAGRWKKIWEGRF